MYIDILELGVVTRTVQVLRTTSGTSTSTGTRTVLVLYSLYCTRPVSNGNKYCSP